MIAVPHLSQAKSSSPEEAGAFVRKLQQMLRRLGSCEADMENGQLRIDVNVSVHKPNTPFNTRCEIKNINSVRFLQQAIESERRRHIRHYENHEDVKQETRQFDEVKGETYSLRSKEEAEDYRYMPDSNLPAMVFEQVSCSFRVLVKLISRGIWRK
jgi:aspartyl-tRNA(Asn)/glutamyl-tRNA(Gln) amidotransferase subunit B